MAAIAHIYVGLWEREQALDWLERSVDTGPYIYDLAVNPTLRSLHSEPRFQALLQKVRLAE